MTLNHYSISVTLSNETDRPPTRLYIEAAKVPAGDLAWIEPFIQAEMALQAGPATYVVKRGAAIVKRGSIDLGERLPVDQHKPGCQCLPCFEREYAAHPADCPCMVCQDIRNAPGAKAAEAKPTTIKLSGETREITIQEDGAISDEDFETDNERNVRKALATRDDITPCETAAESIPTDLWGEDEVATLWMLREHGCILYTDEERNRMANKVAIEALETRCEVDVTRLAEVGWIVSITPKGSARIDRERPLPFPLRTDPRSMPAGRLVPFAS